VSRAVVKPGKKRTQAVEAASTRKSARGPLEGDDHIVLRRAGKAVGVVISIAELRYFQELEDRLDVRDAEKALADPKRIPYEEVRLKLGL